MYALFCRSHFVFLLASVHSQREGRREGKGGMVGMEGEGRAKSKNKKKEGIGCLCKPTNSRASNSFLTFSHISLLRPREGHSKNGRDLDGGGVAKCKNLDFYQPDLSLFFFCTWNQLVVRTYYGFGFAYLFSMCLSWLHLSLKGLARSGNQGTG